MIRATLKDTKIVVTANEQDAITAAQLPGATRTAKMPPRTWHMPLNCESIDTLRSVGARASRELVAEAKRLAAVRRYVEDQKGAERVVPLCPIPVKPDVQLYMHQIKGYNIMLALFGYCISSWR